jgi:uncharacterized damage-inducible protein DinB
MASFPLEQVPSSFRRYVEHVYERDLLTALQESNSSLLELLLDLHESKGEYRYQPGKWSIKELLCHMMDAERIFSYRALRFSRGDKTALHGFEENDYAPQANAHGRPLAQILHESDRLRATTIDLFAACSQEMLLRTGTANGAVVSVAMLGYIIAGHQIHHIKILRERYL